MVYRRCEFMCKLQTLAAMVATEEVIFKGYTLFLGQSTKRYASTVSSRSAEERTASMS